LFSLFTLPLFSLLDPFIIIITTITTIITIIVIQSIIDRAWQEGWVVPSPPKVRTGKSVMVSEEK
jgi:hypothetical protein